MDNSTIGLLVFIAGFIGGRLIKEQGLKSLSEEEKAVLVKGFSRYRIFSVIGLVLLVLTHFGVRGIYPNSLVASSPVLIGVMVFYLLGSSFIAFKKLHQLNMPDHFITKFLISTLVQYVGIFVFFGLSLSK